MPLHGYCLCCIHYYVVLRIIKQVLDALQEHRRLQTVQNEARYEKQRIEAQAALQTAAIAAAEKQKGLQERVKRDLAEEAAQKVLSLQILSILPNNKIFCCQENHLKVLSRRKRRSRKESRQGLPFDSKRLSGLQRTNWHGQKVRASA